MKFKSYSQFKSERIDHDDRRETYVVEHLVFRPRWFIPPAFLDHDCQQIFCVGRFFDIWERQFRLSFSYALSEQLTDSLVGAEVVSIYLDREQSPNRYVDVESGHDGEKGRTFRPKDSFKGQREVRGARQVVEFAAQCCESDGVEGGLGQVLSY